MPNPAYKPLRYPDVAEKLERLVRDRAIKNLGDESAAWLLSHWMSLPIKTAWVAVARGTWKVPRV